MDRVFLYANVLFSAVYTSDFRLRSLWSLPATKLVTSELALEELVMLAPPKASVLADSSLGGGSKSRP